jgi:hypothetical protein
MGAYAQCAFLLSLQMGRVNKEKREAGGQGEFFADFNIFFV